MDSKATAVFGIFQEVSRLKRAATVLREAKYRDTAVSVLFPDTHRTADFGYEKNNEGYKDPTISLGMGATIGGVFGWLTRSGVLALPRPSPFIGSGPIAAAVASVGVGAVLGGIIGGFVHLRIGAYKATRQGKHRNGGGFLLSVLCENKEWPNGPK